MDRRTFVKTVGAGAALALMPGVTEAKQLTNLYVPLPGLGMHRRILPSGSFFDPGVYYMWINLGLDRQLTQDEFALLEGDRHRARHLHFVDHLVEAEAWANFVAKEFHLLCFVGNGPTHGDENYVYDSLMTIVFKDVHVCSDKNGLFISAPGQRSRSMLDGGIKYPDPHGVVVRDSDKLRAAQRAREVATRFNRTLYLGRDKDNGDWVAFSGDAEWVALAGDTRELSFRDRSYGERPIVPRGLTRPRIR